jgi:hypothetical protein
MGRSGRTRGAVPQLAALLVASLLVAACGGAVTPTPAPAVEPTPAPTATPAAVDVAEVFVTTLLAAQTGRLPVSGTVTFGTTEATLSGGLQIAGQDSSTTLTIDVSGARQTQDSVRIGTQRWTREDPGPWVLDPDPADPEQGLAAFLSTLTALEDQGVATKDGRELHRLLPPAGTAVTPEALGLDPSIENADVSLEFWAEPDGTPAIWSVGVGWTQAAPDGSTPIEFVMDVDLAGLGEPVALEPPADAWTRFVSSRLGYSIAHPADWRVVEDDGQDVLARGEEAFIYVAPQSAPGQTLDRFTEELVAYYERELGAVFDTNEASTLGGKPARFVTGHFESDQGRLFLADTIAMRGDTGWEVYLLNQAGTEETDLEALALFLGTFEFRE